MFAIDVHTHLHHPTLLDRLDAVWTRSSAAGVRGVVVSASAPDTWPDVRDAAARWPGPSAYTLGLHPWWVADTDTRLDAQLDQLYASDHPHGIGETGLDHHRARTKGARQLQQRSLRAHLALARSLNVPLVLHGVQAWSPLLAILEEEGLPDAGGFAHAWEGPAELVPRAVDVGLCLSFGPSLQHNRRARAAVTAVPDDRLLLETDAPDRPVSGAEIGEPADLLTVAALAASLRRCQPDALLHHSAVNAKRLFPALSIAGSPSGART